MSYVLIVGARSDIAQATAREYEKHGYDIYLAARNSNNLNEFAKDVAVRTNQKVKTADLDILDYASHQGFYDNLEEKPLGVICAVGYLGEQPASQSSFVETQKIINIIILNYVWYDELSANNS